MPTPGPRYLFPSFRVDDRELLFGVDGVDDDLSRVVGPGRTCHKVFCGPVTYCGDRIAWIRKTHKHTQNSVPVELYLILDCKFKESFFVCVFSPRCSVLQVPLLWPVRPADGVKVGRS